MAVHAKPGRCSTRSLRGVGGDRVPVCSGYLSRSKVIPDVRVTPWGAALSMKAAWP